MAYGAFKDLQRRTDSDKVLCNNTFGKAFGNPRNL